MLSRLGALAGIGAAASVAGTGVADAGAPPRTRALVLHGSGLRVLGPQGRAVAGSSRTVRGTVSHTAGGPAQGDFFAQGTVLAEHRMLDPELGVLETQLFTLGDATITGTGTVHHDGTGRFTITGGSGAYAGARGHYTTRQSADHSGTGEAVFTFEIG